MERSAFLGSYVRETRIGNAGPLGTACEPKSKIYETLNESPFFVVRGISSRVQRASARLDARLARAIFSSFWEAQSSIFFFEPRLELGSARVLKESSRVLEDLDLRTWDENESRVLL